MVMFMAYVMMNRTMCLLGAYLSWLSFGGPLLCFAGLSNDVINDVVIVVMVLIS